MTETREVTVKIHATTSASATALRDHLDSLIATMKHQVEVMADHSWNRQIMVNWEDSEPVDLEIKLEADLP
jgi:hypothetical protein